MISRSTRRRVTIKSFFSPSVVTGTTTTTTTTTMMMIPLLYLLSTILIIKINTTSCTALRLGLTPQQQRRQLSRHVLFGSSNHFQKKLATGFFRNQRSSLLFDPHSATATTTTTTNFLSFKNARIASTSSPRSTSAAFRQSVNFPLFSSLSETDSIGSDSKNKEHDNDNDEKVTNNIANNKNEDNSLGAWIPMASATSLFGLGPQRVTVMGHDFVIWHSSPPKKKSHPTSSSAIQWSILHDVCPHRLAPLSQGRVDPSTNCIECPYHGWQFDTNGTVLNIPQLDDNNNNNNNSSSSNKNSDYNARSIPVSVCGDLIFGFLPTSIHGESFPRSLTPWQMYGRTLVAATTTTKVDEKNNNNSSSSSSSKIYNEFYVRDLPYSADFLVENFMDPSHIPFAHHKLQATRNDASPIPMKQLVMNFTHVEVTFSDKSGQGGQSREGIVSFQRPSLYHFRTKRNNNNNNKEVAAAAVNNNNDNNSANARNKDTIKEREKENEEDEYQYNLCIFCVPVAPGRSRVLFPNFFSNTWWFPQWLGHAGSNRFLNTDTWLHDAERTIRSRSSSSRSDADDSLGKQQQQKKSEQQYIYASQADGGVAIFRRWYNRFGFADKPSHAFGPSRLEELLISSKSSKSKSSSSTSFSSTGGLSRREQTDPWEWHSKQCSICRRALKRAKRMERLGLLLVGVGCFLGKAAGAGAGAGAGSGSKSSILRAAAVAGVGLVMRAISQWTAHVIEGHPRPSGVPDRSASALAD